MMKRILSFLLAFLMVVSIFPAQAFATGNTDVTITPTEGVTEPTTEEPTATPCITCGQYDCTSNHLTWCAECKKDDCGVDHTAAVEAQPCEKCSSTECAGHENWCDICKIDNCGKEHKQCETCGTIDCTKEHKACEICSVIDCTADHTNWCDICKFDNCGKDHSGTDTQTQDPSSDQVDAVSEDETTDPLVGRTATFNTDSIWLYSAPGALSQIVAKSQLPASVVITEVNGDYYRVDAANGAVWPSDYEQSKYVKSSVLTLDQEKAPCPVCGQTDCTTEHKQCGICGEYDCTAVHFYCEICKDYDCGKAHAICPACGTVDCTQPHSWCGHCSDYDCGIQHEDEYKPDTTPAIPSNPERIPGEAVTVVDEQGNAISTLSLEEGRKTSISAWPAADADSYQWQVRYNNANDLWVDIAGATGKGILVSPAMFLNIIDYQGSTAIRCVATSGDEVQISDAIPVIVEEAVPQQEMMMFAARPGTTGSGDAVVTAEGDGAAKYSIIIEFKFQNGDTAAQAWTASLSAGQDYVLDVECPDVVGYKPDRERITATITAISGNMTYTVTYMPDYVDYKVIHHQQNIGDNNYTAVKTETMTGLTGSPVGTGLEESYDGFYDLVYDPEITVAADGSTVINVYYDRYYYLVSLDMNGGYGVEPIYARYGTPINASTLVPQRTGYAFSGWSPALPSAVNIGGSNHTAQWTKADTGFTVAFWYENPNDEEYSFVGSVQQTATTGSKVNGEDYWNLAFEGRDNEHFTYEKADTNVEIAADGSTVVNVYFTRNSYTLTYYKWKCLHTHTNDCCSLTVHTHTNACCNLQHTSHSDSCCSIPYHTGHTTGCVANEIKKGTTYIPESDLNDAVPNRYNGVWTTYKYLGQTRYYVWFDGSWYRTADGNNGKDPIEWDCMSQGRNYTHDHTSGCTCTKYHDHSSGRLGSCNLASCSNGGNAHTHGSGCNTNGCKHSTYFGCESDISNMNHWTVFYQGTFKYGQDVSAVHAAQGTERWCPGACEGLKDADGNYYASYGQSPAHGVYSSMGGGDVVFFQGGAGSVEYKLTFWLETYDGSGSRNYNGKNFAQGTTFTAKMGAVGYYGDYKSGCPDPGFTVYEAWTSDSIGGANGVQLNVGDVFQGSTYIYYNFYYARATYDLTYFNGSNVVATRTMKYEEPLTSSYNLQNLTMTSPYGSGYYFAGWYLDADCTIPVSWGSTRMPDGGMAVYAKWAPITHTVTTYQTKGGTKLGTYTATHGTAVGNAPANPTRSGYNFVSWFYMEDGVEKAYNFSMPVYKDMELYAVWTSDSLANGTISYMIAGTNTKIAEDTPISGLVGNSKTYNAKTGTELSAGYQTGYFPETSSHNIEFSTTASQNNWIFYYTKMDDVAYTVRYVDKDTGTELRTATTEKSNVGKITVTHITIPGYAADAYSKDLILSSDPALNVVTFYYTKDDVHAPVQVEHYIQNTEGTGYIHYFSEQPYNGTIGDTQTATPLTLTGFTHIAEKSINGVELTASGLVLKLYYDRNPYGFTFRFLEQGTDKELAAAVTGSGLYNATVSQIAEDIPGYDLQTAGSLTITIGADENANVRTFYYVEDSVTIQYQVGSVKGGTVSKDSETVLAVTGTPAGSTAAADADYVFTGWYTNYACTEKVSDDAAFVPGKTDGVYVTDVYYAGFAEVKVTINYQIDGPSGSATLSKTTEQVSVLTGKATGSTVTAADKYAFAGWFDADGNKVSDSATFAPTKPGEKWVDGTTYYAKIVEKKATINYVAVGNGSVTPATEEVSMVTGTASGATATATENISRFVGWYDNAACEGAALSNDATFAPTLPSGGWAETQTYYAKFENISYTITFEDRGNTVKTQDYVYGDTLTLPEVSNGDYLVTWTVKESSGDWEKDTKVKNGVINHYGDVTLVANWTITAVWIDSDFTFTNLNGDILDSALDNALFVQEDVPYGTDPVYAGDLSTDQLAAAKNDAQFTYTFKEWAEVDLSIYEPLLQEEIKGVVVYRAVYEKSVNKYTVTWQDDEGNTIDTTEVAYGTIPTHDDPTKEATDEYTYTFAGWTPEVVAVTGDATYQATFTSFARSYTITYELNGGTLAEGIDNPTTYTAETETFTLNNPTRAGYKFKGWATDDNAAVGTETITIEKGTTGDKTYYAVWERSFVDLTITATAADSEQNFIFTVSGKRSDGVTFAPIDVVLCSENNFQVTIKDLPVGEYTVTEKDDWSWRENAVSSKTADLRTESKTLSFDFDGVDKLRWLSGYSYKRKKGGS